MLVCQQMFACVTIYHLLALFVVWLGCRMRLKTLASTIRTFIYHTEITTLWMINCLRLTGSRNLCVHVHIHVCWCLCKTHSYAYIAQWGRRADGVGDGMGLPTVYMWAYLSLSLRLESFSSTNSPEFLIDIQAICLWLQRWLHVLYETHSTTVVHSPVTFRMHGWHALSCSPPLQLPGLYLFFESLWCMYGRIWSKCYSFYF